MGHSTSSEDSVKRGWEVTGDTNMWELLCKAVNLDTGEYHSTKMLRLGDGGCLIQCDSTDRLGNLVRTTTECSVPMGLANHPPE